MRTLGIISLGVILSLWITAGWAHGHYDWIMRNPHTSSCCGPQDCRAIDGRLVRYEEPGKWFVQGKQVPQGKTFQSADNGFHACYYDPGRWEEPRCLFIPGMS